MAHHSPSTPQFSSAFIEADGLLETWKEIANYLNRDVRTVKRWEHTRGLPVHRLPGEGGASVYARKAELDAWRANMADYPANAAALPLDHSTRKPGGPPSIAVLPFLNLTADRENEHFGDGLADGIITLLTRIPGLRVTARTSAFAFRGQDQDVRDIGAKLGVKTVLEGSLQRAGNSLRISAQLVSAEDGFHLWSKQFDHEMTDWFAVQDELARAISASIHAGVGEKPSPSCDGTPNREAYSHWLRGRSAFYQRRTLASLQLCRESFERAIALDPKYAAPYVGLAEHARVVLVLGLIPPRMAGSIGEAAARKALELDKTLGEAHALLGLLRAAFDYDWRSAENHFRQALALSPASPSVHSGWAMYHLVPRGRLEEADSALKMALDLDPLSPELHGLQAQLRMFQRDLPGAKNSANNALAAFPEFAFAHWILGMVSLFEGHPEEAKVHCERCVQLYGPVPNAIAAIAAIDGFLGQIDRAEASLRALEAEATARYINPVMLAWIHLGLRQFDEALNRLEQALELRDPHLLHLPVKPIYDGLRGHPRFQKILERMHLAS